VGVLMIFMTGNIMILKSEVESLAIRALSRQKNVGRY